MSRRNQSVLFSEPEDTLSLSQFLFHTHTHRPTRTHRVRKKGCECFIRFSTFSFAVFPLSSVLKFYSSCSRCSHFSRFEAFTILIHVFYICSVPIDFCSLLPCRNDGRCQNTGTSYICHCPSNFRGPRCEHCKKSRTFKILNNGISVHDPSGFLVNSRSKSRVSVSFQDSFVHWSFGACVRVFACCVGAKVRVCVRMQLSPAA